MRILLKDSMESCKEDTEVKVVIFLKRASPSSTDGRLPNCVKMVSLMSPLIDDLMHVNIDLQF